MKVSKFNFYYPLPNQDILIYNTATNSLAVIEEENFTYIKDKANKNVIIEDQELLNNLLLGGFVVENSVNELDLLKLKLLESRFDKRGFSLTIAPTLDCDFECIYCYEKNNQNNTYMSLKTQNQLMNFIQNRLRGLEKFKISWYGGEPLLAMDIIENLSNKIIKICRERHIEYSANIVTNGYSLTTEIAQKLKDFAINKVQITLDGPKDTHNLRRPLKNGGPTFEKILENIKNVCDILTVAIRVNVDKKNIEQFDEVLDILVRNKLQSKIQVYLGFVDDANNCYSPAKCLSSNKFFKLNYETNKKIRAKNFMNTKKVYPELVNNYCGADHIAHYVVGPTGLLYKCVNDIGIRNKAVDSIFYNSSNKYNISLYNAYMLNMPTEDPVCSKCNLLPICMGGCPHTKINSKKNSCSEYKYNLENYLKQYAQDFI